jgi:hypothetical protein
MPTYEFEVTDADGTKRVVEEWIPLAEYPRIGEKRALSTGETGVRVLSSIPNGQVPNYEHVAYQLPRWDARAPRHDHRGRAVFANKQEAVEYGARSGVWDPNR